MITFYRRMWWFIIVGGFLMLAGLGVNLVRPGLHWYSTAFVFAGTSACTVGYCMILWYDRRHRNDRGGL